MTKRPPITTRTNIGWTYTYLPAKLDRVVLHPDVIATPAQLEERIYGCKLNHGLGRWGMKYIGGYYRKLGGKWVRLTRVELERLGRLAAKERT